MPLPDIQLDDRRFEELFDEAKRKIPGYTPEWTDLNESDPGITMLQLFAWLSEMILWRLNRVPDKNYLKFLELIGIQLRPPTPAKAELTFKLSAKSLDTYVPILQGTQVALSESVDGKQVIFETDDNLYAVSTELRALQSFDSAQYQILDEANRVAGKYFYPFGPNPRRNAAFYLGFDHPGKLPFPPDEAVTYKLLIHAYTDDLIEEGEGIKAEFGDVSAGDTGENDLTPCPLPGRGMLAAFTDTTPPVMAFWEYWAGSTVKWRRLDVRSDTTANLTRTGTVDFVAPTDIVKEQIGLLRKPEDDPLFWFRYRIEQELGPGYEIPPRVQDVLLNTVNGTNAVTINDELLGASLGSPNQTFRLSKTPVLPERLVIEVDEGEGFVAWTRVRDFAGSRRDDKHYTIELATGVISFGDGEQGKIPRRLREDQANIKAKTYRSGGGAAGNAGANKITSLQSAVPYVESVANLRPAFGGEDEESIEQVKQRAPETIRTLSRAVTACDFEALARQTPGARIRRAHALPLHHPDLEPRRPVGAGLPATAVPVPGVITVLVVPETLKDNPKPIPSQDTINLVTRWLNQHRLITTELYVTAPRYRKVEIETQVIAKPTVNSGEVHKRLEAMLLEYFHPLHGGKDGKGWDFGGTISFAEVHRRILNIDGVDRIKDGAVKIRVDDKPPVTCADIPLNEDELVYSDKHAVNVSYA
jgi:predicted phage baseplate assembly protein